MSTIYITARWQQYGIQAVDVTPDPKPGERVTVPGLFGGIDLRGEDWYASADEARTYIVDQLKQEIEQIDARRAEVIAKIDLFLSSKITVQEQVTVATQKDVVAYVEKADRG